MPRPGHTTDAIGIVAGSGMQLRGLFDRVDWEIPFGAIAAMPSTTVAGHPGTFLLGEALGQRVVLQQGRFHVYEGLPLESIVAPVAALQAMGCREILFCNAAGGLWPTLQPGELVAITHVASWRFARMPLPRRVDADFLAPGCDDSGSYLWVSGPSYETRAEIRAMRGLGHAVVGMSTLPEMDYARRLGLRCAAIACVTNSCVNPAPLSHAHVLAAARDSSTALRQTLRRYLASKSAVPSPEPPPSPNAT